MHRMPGAIYLTLKMESKININTSMTKSFHKQGNHAFEQCQEDFIMQKFLTGLRAMA